MARSYNEILAEEKAKAEAAATPTPVPHRFRPVPNATITLLHPFEGLRLRAYDDQQPNRTSFARAMDVIGVPTIGYGHTGSDVTVKHVMQGRTITKAEAERLLVGDLIDAQRKIDLHIKASRIAQMTDNQYAALLSFVFNAGLVSTWTIVSRINAGRFEEVPDQMIRFVYSKGKRMQGLVNRRRAEIDLWRSSGVASAPPEGIEYAPATTPVEAIREVSIKMSRTVQASIVSGMSSIGTGTTAMIEQISPHAHSSDLLKIAMVSCIVIASISAFAAAVFRAQDAASSKA